MRMYCTPMILGLPSSSPRTVSWHLSRERALANHVLLDWNSQTADDLNKLGLHPWCLHTVAQVIAERELWKFADANPDIDVTSSTFPPPTYLDLYAPLTPPPAQSSTDSRLGLMVADRCSTSTVLAHSPGSTRSSMGRPAGRRSLTAHPIRRTMCTSQMSHVHTWQRFGLAR